MQLNFFLVSAFAALVPLIVGFIWYHPKIFGNVWMSVNGFNEAKMKEGNMLLIFFLTLVFGYLICFPLSSLVIHQMGFFSMLQMHLKDSKEAQDFFHQGNVMYGNDFRTFKHGALHGSITGIGLALPIVAINALFERRGFKYIAIHAGYWILTLLLMGGIICQFANIADFGK